MHSSKYFVLILLFILTFKLSSWEIVSAASNRTFPSDFQFGVSTAAYQIEGGWNADGKGDNIWDHLLHIQPDFVQNSDNGDTACDSYHKYMEDVALIRELGVNFYRFSLSWSRILPTGFPNQVNQAGVNYYRNLLLALNDSGIDAMVTLYHWDLPQPLQDIGGWPNSILVEHFASYARLAFELFGDLVKYWATFNEVMQICHAGYGTASLAPGIASEGIGEYLCAHTILKAHAAAYHIYDDEFRVTQNGKIAMIIDTTWFEPASNNSNDQEAAERKLQFNFGWYAHPIFHGNYPQIMIDRIATRSQQEGFAQSRLPEFTADEINYIYGTHDFMGLNSYTTNYAKWMDEPAIDTPSLENDQAVETYQDESWEQAESGWLKVVPWGMRRLVNWVKNTYNNTEIIITENGFSDLGDLNDTRRINYYTEYLSNILNAIYEDDVKVIGYSAWSLLDNFEWTDGYRPRFGLVHVDFTDPNRTRTMKDSAYFYQKIIATRCLVDSCDELYNVLM